MQGDDESRRHTILYGVTVPRSLDVLLHQQMRFMSDRGWRVHAISGPGQPGPEVAKREGLQEWHPIPMTRHISPIRDLVALWKWLRVLRKVRPGVVNVSTPKAGLLGMIAAWLSRVPKRVYIVRGARYQTASPVIRALLVMLERVAVRCATDVIAISPSLREELARQGIDKIRPIRILGSGSGNGIPAKKLRQQYRHHVTTGARERLVGEGSKFVVLFLGRFVRDKGVLDLAEALDDPRLKDAVLLTAGDQEEDINSQHLQALSSQGRWVSYGHIDEVAEILACADVLVLPTYREGLGNVLLEASAVGLPVVGTTAVGAHDAVLEGETGYKIAPGDTRALRERLSWLRDDPALRRRLGEQGARWVRSSFDPEHIWRGLEAIYRDTEQIRGRPPE